MEHKDEQTWERERQQRHGRIEKDGRGMRKRVREKEMEESGG